jgi:hypothetical protein
MEWTIIAGGVVALVLAVIRKLNSLRIFQLELWVLLVRLEFEPPSNEPKKLTEPKNPRPLKPVRRLSE